MRAALSSLPAGPGWLLFLIVGISLALEVVTLWKDWPASAPPPPAIDPDTCWVFCESSGLRPQSWEPFRCSCAPERP